MLMHKYLQSMSNLFMENRLLKLVLIALLLLYVADYIKLREALERQRTILVPPTALTDKVELEGSRVDEAYLRWFTQYLIGLAMVYHPGNVKGKFSELLVHFDAEHYQEAKRHFSEMAEKIRLGSVSSVFHIQDGIRLEKDVARVKGLHIQEANGRRLLEEQKELAIRYRVVDGRLLVQEIWEESKK